MYTKRLVPYDFGSTQRNATQATHTTHATQSPCVLCWRN